MAAQTLFVTGTDTGVGKTFVSCLILRHLRACGIDAAGYKPVCCGDREDAEALARASEISDLAAVNAVWFETPLAPVAAAKREGRTVDCGAMRAGFRAMCSAHERVVIEGAGGWEVPLSGTETMADLAVEFGAPVLVVAANRLGALNHVLLTCGAIQQRGLECAGVVLNHIESPAGNDLAAETNREMLQSVLPEIPVMEIQFGQQKPGERLVKVLGP